MLMANKFYWNDIKILNMEYICITKQQLVAKTVNSKQDQTFHLKKLENYEN